MGSSTLEARLLLKSRERLGVQIKPSHFRMRLALYSFGRRRGTERIPICSQLHSRSAAAFSHSLTHSLTHLKSTSESHVASFCGTARSFASLLSEEARPRCEPRDAALSCSPCIPLLTKLPCVLFGLYQSSHRSDDTLKKSKKEKLPNSLFCAYCLCRVCVLVSRGSALSPCRGPHAGNASCQPGQAEAM